MRLRLLPEAVRALGVPSPRRLPLSSFFSHCQLKERERETKLRYLCKYAISELIDRTKRHPIFPIFFRSSLDYLSFLILPLIQSIRQSSFKIFSLKYSTFLLQHFYPFRITILEFFETLIFRYILKLFKDRSTCDIF